MLPLALLLLCLSSPVHAEPKQHIHCWHEQVGTVVPLPPICCHCGVMKGCEGHGPYKPGCRPPSSEAQTFPLLQNEQGYLRYDYDRAAPPGTPYEEKNYSSE